MLRRMDESLRRKIGTKKGTRTMGGEGEDENMNGMA